MTLGLQLSGEGTDYAGETLVGSLHRSAVI